MKKFAVFFIAAIVFNASSQFSVETVKAAGATLFLSPASGTQIVGRNFAVNVMVNSGGDKGVNAAEAALAFDPEMLSVASLNESGSIFELWTTRPAHNNAQGRITFGGGLPTAYTGSAGKIFTINFTAKKAGTARVDFTSGVVLAADGRGTNIFSGFGNGSYLIEEAAPREETTRPAERPKEEETKGVLPPLPEITSPTHPEEDKWYADNRPELSWRLLSDITGISYNLTAKPDEIPDSVSEGIIENKQYEDVADGEWYFHIKYQNRVGWGKANHRRILIDVTPPELSDVRIDFEGDPTNPSPLLKFNATDQASGIARYEMVLDNQAHTINEENFKEGEYRFAPLAPGERELMFTVFDRADNKTEASLKFFVEPLKPPIITDIPKIITTKEELIIRGTSFYPQVTIKLFLARDGGEPIEALSKADEQNNWNYFHKRNLEKGIYEVWALAIDERGAKSLNSTKHILTVVKPSLIAAYGWLIILILLAIIVLLVIYILYLRQSHAQEIRRIEQEVIEAKVRMNEIFMALREEVDELMETADKKPGLSESERRVKEKLQEALNISQEFLDKEIEDVEKEIKEPKEESSGH